MTFVSGKGSDFFDHFQEVKTEIQQFQGCRELKLLQDINNPDTFFTYSIWENSEALNSYRFSAFFRNTWQKVKMNFACPAEAWSLTIPVRN